MKIWAIGLAVLFGMGFGLVSMAADFNGDGKDDIAIYRPNTGMWSVRGVTATYFGGSNDTPVPADYDGDGQIDFAVARMATGMWSVKNVTRVFFWGIGRSAGNRGWA